MTTSEISAVRQGFGSFAIVRPTSCEPLPLQGNHARRLLISSPGQNATATAASAAGSDQAQSPRYITAGAATMQPTKKPTSRWRAPSIRLLSPSIVSPRARPSLQIGTLQNELGVGISQVCRSPLLALRKLKKRGRGDVRMNDLMNQPVISVRNHCLSPTRAKIAIDAPLSPVSYARMFPELPSFEADEQFLHALGRAGGICDCGDIEDAPDSLGDTAAGWAIFGQFVAHNITADRSILQSHTNTAELHNARCPQLNLESLYGDGPTGHPFLYQHDDPAKFLGWTEQTCNETQRASRLSATRATIRIRWYRSCISPCSRFTTRLSMKRGSPE
jgi:hypothetical protein